ncbi:MAG: hypothetical protein IM638_03550 [Bacteroidetes bacterium]|nr:hypothetical protein [Bacteroidota bacterium]
MRILSLAGLVAFLMLAFTTCKEKKTPEELLCEQNTYEPYSVELFEFKTTPDTTMVIYFNREVSEEDVPLEVVLYFGVDSSSRTQKAAYIQLPLKKTKGRKLSYKIPLNEPEIDSLNTYAKRELFNVYVWVSANNKLSYKYGSIRPAKYAGETTEFYPDSTRSFSYRGMKQLTRATDSLLRKKLCFADNEMVYLWLTDNYRYYSGKYNDSGKKHGHWKCFYSNGKTMFEGEFKDGVQIDVFLRYNYYGTLCDTVKGPMWW